jgi:hypothetical protein
MLAITVLHLVRFASLIGLLLNATVHQSCLWWDTPGGRYITSAILAHVILQKGPGYFTWPKPKTLREVQVVDEYMRIGVTYLKGSFPNNLLPRGVTQDC